MKRLTFLTLLAALVLAAPAGAAVTKQTMRQADRQAVNALLDRFIPSVLAGKDLKGGKALVGGYITVGTVQRYPAEPGTYHGWLLNYATPGDVGFDVLVQPMNKRKVGAWSFRGEAQKVKGTWKIVNWYPVAQFQPVGKAAWLNGPNDLTPGARGGLGAKNTTKWLLAPVVFVGVIVLLIAVFGGRHWLRTRSRVRQIERTLASSR